MDGLQSSPRPNVWNLRICSLKWQLGILQMVENVQTLKEGDYP